MEIRNKLSIRHFWLILSLEVMQIAFIQECYTMQFQNIIAWLTVLHWKLVSIILTVCQTATVGLHLTYTGMTYSVFTCFSDYMLHPVL